MKFLKNTIPIFLLSSLLFSAKAQVGNPAPDFTVTDTHGEAHTLYDYLEAGKVVVLDFFYTTCGPCQYYSPQVNLAYEKYGCNNANVIFMSIDYQDSDAQVIAYDQQYEIEYPSISGLDGGGDAVVNLYNIFGFPTFYVIDSTKTIIEEIDPPTLQVFDFRFANLGIEPADCNVSAASETSRSGRLNVFPNPFSNGVLQAQLPGTTIGESSFEIFNSVGHSIRYGTTEFKGENTVGLEVGDLQQGLYLLKVNDLNSNKVYTSFFVKE